MKKVCATCSRKTAVGIDSCLIGLVQTIKSCLQAGVPFLPLDLSTPVWSAWLSRVPYCIKFVTSTDASLLRVPGLTKDDDCVYRHCSATLDSKYLDILSRDDVIYIVMTSGTSSPQPKIVYVTKSCIYPNISDFRSWMNIGAKSVLYCTSPLTFDPAILYILIALDAGCKVLLSNHGLKEPLKLIDYLKENRVTHIQAVPSFLRLLQLDQVARVLLTPDTSVRVISMGGEHCLTGAELHALCGGSESVINKVMLYNVYGLTEQSVWSTIYKITADYVLSKSADPLPIGVPLSDTQFSRKSHSDTDEEYELVLCSETRVSYIDDGCDFIPTVPHFHTGDMVRQTSDHLYMTGRINTDFVKRAGVRINLLFLSQQAMAHPDVLQAYTHFDCDRETGLVLLYSGVLPPSELQLQLKHSLPEYYAPDHAVRIDTFPVNSHGKLDRRKLIEKINQYLQSLHSSTTVDLIKMYVPDPELEKTFTENGGSSVQALALSSQLLECGHMVDTQHEVLQAVLNLTIQDLCDYIEAGYSTMSAHKSEYSAVPAHKRRRVDATAILNTPEDSSLEILTVVQKDCTTAPYSTLSKPVSLSKMWTVDTGKCVDATPTLISTGSEQYAYIGSHSHEFLCINVSNGEVRWKTTLGGRIEATAAVSKKHKLVFVGCYDTYLYCMNAFSGEIMYAHLCGDVIKSTPAVDGDFLYFGSHDQNIYCLNLMDFSLVWKTRLNGAIYSTSLIHKEFIYIGTLAGSLYQLGKHSGNILEDVSLGAPIFSSVSLVAESVIISTVAGICTCRKYSSLSVEIWTFKASGPIFSTPLHILDDDRLVFGCHDKHVYCLNSQTGNLMWKVLCNATVGCSPYPYKVGSSVWTLISSTKGTLYSIDVQSGDVISLYTLPVEVFSSPVVMDRKLAVGCRDDQVYCFNMT